MRLSRLPLVALPVGFLLIALLTACGGGPAAPFVQITAGGEHTCGMRSDGSVDCWGSNEYGQLKAPKDEQFSTIIAGPIHTCGLREDGSAYCWGDTELPGAAIPGWPTATIPVTFPPEDEQLLGVSIEFRRSCGLRNDGSLVCWNREETYQPLGTELFKDISSGSFLTGLRMDGSAVSYVTNTNFDVPEEEFVAIESGSSHACGLRSDGIALCWGHNSAGAVSPVAEGPFSAIAVGGHHSCGLRLDGTAACWGADAERLEQRTAIRASRLDRMRNNPPTAAPEGERFTSIAAGALHTCGVRLDGGISCWGDDERGQASPPDS